jgi:hypothetical protein
MVYEKFAAGLEEGLEKSAAFTLKSVLGPVRNFLSKIFPSSSPPLRYPRYRYKFKRYDPSTWFAPLPPGFKERGELSMDMFEDYFNKRRRGLA